jgi:signal transduction histidine kinase
MRELFGEYSRQNRGERLIAGGRLAVAACGFVGVLLDPPDRTPGVTLIEVLLAVYLAYATYGAIRAWRARDVPSMAMQIATHVVDLLLPTVLLDVTRGPASPFFPLLAFPLLAATVRWYRWGTLYTGAASLVAYVVITAHVGPRLVLDIEFALRAVYLIVATVLLSYLGESEKRARREITTLAAWMEQAFGPGQERFADVVRRAASVLSVPRLLVVWVEPDQTWVNLAFWANDSLAVTQEPPAALEWLVAEPLANVDFVCADAAAADARVRCVSPEPIHWRGAPLHAKLQSAFDIHRVLALRLRGGLFEGRVFVLDRRGITSEDVALAAIVARQIEHRLELDYLARIRHAAVVAMERGRVARDVHDGVLQSLTSVALQLETIRRLLETRPQAAADAIEDLQSMLLVEQQSLRAFVRQLQGDTTGTDSGLGDLLTELVQRLQREWRLDIKLNILCDRAALNGAIPAALAREVYQILREALVNVARHARASSAWVTVDLSDEQVFLLVADDGVGFRFHGTVDHAKLVRRGDGPRMLLGRVGALGGTVTIGSGSAGSRLTIKLPLAR